MLQKTPGSVFDRHQIMVISDLHFPRSDSHPKYVYEALLYNPSDSLIILGDLYEGYDKKLGQFNEWHMRVLDLIHHRMYNEGLKVYILPGNHDAYMRSSPLMEREVDGITYLPEMVLNGHGGLKTFAFHGDRLDEAFTREAGHKMYEIGKKLHLIGLYTQMRIIADKAKKLCSKGNRPVNEKFHKMAADLASERGCNAALTGHKHELQDFLRVKGTEVYSGNTGCAVGGVTTFMRLTRNGNWEAVDWRQERRQEHKLTATWKMEATPNPYTEQREATLAHLDMHKRLHNYYVSLEVLRLADDLIVQLEALKEMGPEKVIQAATEAQGILRGKDFKSATLDRGPLDIPVLPVAKPYGGQITAPGHCTPA